MRDQLRLDSEFIEKNKENIAASIQDTIIRILLSKLRRAARETGITEVAIAGGVSANSGLREQLLKMAEKERWKVYLPGLQFTTDNAAMIAITGYFKYLNKDFASQDIVPYAKNDFR
jgi:N6-L-threonylcarbamoyladenine synthase